MLVLHVIWIVAAVLVGCAVVLWIALLGAHALAKRADEMDAKWREAWMIRLLDVLDGTAPVGTLPVPASKGEMESVIGLLREFGERFRGSYSNRMGSVLGQIQADAFGLRLLRKRDRTQRLRGCALLAWCGDSVQVDDCLKRALDDRDPRVVLEAAAALVRRQAVDDIVPLVRSLCRSGAARSLLARDVMRQWGKGAAGDWSALLTQQWPEDGWILLLEAAGSAARGDWTTWIARLVRHPSPAVVNAALAALSASGDPDGSLAAELACHHDKETVREQAARTLADCGNPSEILPVLEKMLLDPSFDVRRAAMDGILKLGGGKRLRGRVPADHWQYELFNEAGLLAADPI